MNDCDILDTGNITILGMVYSQISLVRYWYITISFVLRFTPINLTFFGVILR